MKRLHQLTTEQYTNLSDCGMLQQIYPEATGRQDLDLKSPALAEKYLDDQCGGGWGIEWPPPEIQGFEAIRVLEFLNGQPWNEIALAYIHSLRPRRVRVIEHGKGAKADFQTWRVTVWLKPGNKLIDCIQQEVVVGLPEGVENGSHLRSALCKQKGEE